MSFITTPVSANINGWRKAHIHLWVELSCSTKPGGKPAVNHKIKYVYNIWERKILNHFNIENRNRLKHAKHMFLLNSEKNKQTLQVQGEYEEYLFWSKISNTCRQEYDGFKGTWFPMSVTVAHKNHLCRLYNPSSPHFSCWRDSIACFLHLPS